jgi:transcription antitermination factor NusG
VSCAHSKRWRTASRSRAQLDVEAVARAHLLAVDLAEELALALHEAALPLAGQALPAGSQLGRDGSALRRERERLHDDDEREEHVRPAISFEVGDTVKVADGPFQSQNGIVEEIDPERGKLRVA